MAEFTKIKPDQFIPLSYQLADGSLAPTRYVRAIIVNYSTRATITTVNLTNNGGGDFSNYSKTPASLSLTANNYFEVLIKVYKDSGYATEDSLRYAIKKYIYYIADDTSGILLGNNAGSVGNCEKIDLDELVKKIFEFNPDEAKKKTGFGKRMMDLIGRLNSFENDSEIKMKNLADLMAENRQITVELFAETIKTLSDRLKNEMEKFENDFENESLSKSEIVEILAEMNESFSLLKNPISRISEFDFEGLLADFENKMKDLTSNIENSDMFSLKLDVMKYLRDLEVKIDGIRDEKN